MSTETAASSQVLDRALELLSHLRDHDQVRVSDLVDVLNTPRSNVYRLLRSLESQGLVRRWNRGHVGLGLRFLDFSHVIEQRVEHRFGGAARRVMQELTDTVGETTLLTMPSGPYAICVQAVECENPIRLSYAKGRVMPLYAGASGEILLPWIDEHHLQMVVAFFESEQSVHDGGRLPVDDLRRNIERIRAQGYCITEGEVDPGATGISAPIFVAGHRLLGGLSIAGPTSRLTRDRHPQLVDLVIGAARRIGAACSTEWS